MSLHVFGNVVTQYGLASNNRGDNQGSNISPLQKLIWKGEPHTTVSAESMRFALRRELGVMGKRCNRQWVEHSSEIPEAYIKLFPDAKKRPQAPCNVWQDPEFGWYRDISAVGYADDDLLGFMSADAGEEEAIELEQADPGSETTGEKKKRKRARGTSFIRRSVLEFARAVSLTAWDGNFVFNVASVGASVEAGGSDPMPYNCEVHATRYQYGFSMTPERLRDRGLAATAVRAIAALNTVAGNHGRFLFDFSPESIVLRITDDPAPRLLYCFDSSDDGKTVSAQRLIDRISGGDIDPKELIIGGAIAADEGFAKAVNGAALFPHGVKKAIDAACTKINQTLNTKE